MDNGTLPPKLDFACPKPWQEMRVDGDRRRFCDQCQRHVHDLSTMTAREGTMFLTKARGELCVSFERRPDGSVVTRHRWTRLAQRWQRVRRSMLAFGSLLAPFAFASCNQPPQEKYRMGGAICVNPEPPKVTPAPSPAQVETVAATPFPGGWPPPGSAEMK